MSKIKWNLPGPDEPGYLRRRREVIELLDAEPSAESHDKIVEFLEPYVEDPDTLLDCSRAEYGMAMLAFLGYGFSVPDPKGDSSAPQ